MLTYCITPSLQGFHLALDVNKPDSIDQFVALKN
jgi:hypothetical protein